MRVSESVLQCSCQTPMVMMWGRVCPGGWGCYVEVKVQEHGVPNDNVSASVHMGGCRAVLGDGTRECRADWDYGVQ